MITDPPRQRDLRAPRAPRRHPPRPRTSPAAQQAVLASRLTPRDRWILRMVHEHRVLTSTQLTTLAFPSVRSARQRLRELYELGVLHRFQPLVTPGTAPLHHVLAPAGATALAAEHGLEPREIGYRPDRALTIAHSLRLAHLLGVNDFFTALVAHTRQHPDSRLTAWWSETRCARYFGDLVRPDAYGRWATGSTEIEFFLEFDFGTEPLTRVAAKLPGYAQLAATTAITTPVLIWLPTTTRETTVRRLLTHTHASLDHPHHVPLATAATDHLHHPDPSPADPVWLPLPTGDTARRPLLDLGHPRRLPTQSTETVTAPRAGRGPLPAPIPMPPSHRHSKHQRSSTGAEHHCVAARHPGATSRPTCSGLKRVPGCAGTHER